MSDSTFTFTAEVRPICQLGMSDVVQPEPDEWVDISCYVIEAELYRGRDRLTDRFDVGTASITFRNSDGWADLVGAPDVVATQQLRPGRPIRVGVEGPWDGALPYVRWLWRGWIDQATPDYDPVEYDVVTINCIDALGEAGSAPAPLGPFVGTNEPAGTRIDRILDVVEWFSIKRKIDFASALVQGTTMGAQGIDLMGQAADSAGGVVFGDLDGDVVFRDLDWMLYDPDIPPDGTIGNVDPGFPGVPGGPGYIDPERGYVYDPDPPLTPPTTIRVCATDGEGTLLEQGDGVDIFVQDGRLYFRWEGVLWDLGEWTGGCVEITTPDAPGSLPGRSDGPISGDGPYVPYPDDATEVPPEAEPPLVELLAWRDLGLADTPQGVATLGPVTPGADCWLVVLCTVIGAPLNPSPLVPTIEGGPGDWTLVQGEDQDSDGASSFIWVTDPVRADPGAFSVVVDWAGDARGYAITVWKVRRVRSDYRTRIDAGLVLRATTDSNPPLEVEPGDGPQTIELTDGDGTPGTTSAGHVIIAQSIAEEATGPFGATFATETPPWTVTP